MEQVTLEARYREKTGKEYCRKLRQKGCVPAILYGKNFEPIPLEIAMSDIQRVLSSEAGVNAILNLTIAKNGSEETHTAMIADVQSDILQRHFNHVDLHKVSLDEKVHATVKVVLKGEARGVKEGGGLLEQLLWELDIEAMPLDVPKHIEVDITNVGLGQPLAVKDIAAPQGVKILNDPTENILVIAEHRGEVIATEIPAAPAAEPAAKEA
jgi:large subunit ribosomal protein L25